MKNSLLLMLIIGLFAVLSAQSVTVTAPNGGETLTRGTPVSITWIKSGFTENVKIELYKNGVLQNNIATSVSGTSYNWTVPNSIFGSDFKIKVTSVNAAFINDYSDNNFTIYGGVININTPNGGEVLQRGQAYNITWTDDLSENVKIELYQANVLSSTIATSVPSNGTFSWTVPNNVSGTDFQIKVSSMDITEINDLSNADFTINSGSITITSPNGGESINRGSDLQITWTDNISENVKIELMQNGSLHTLIAASVVSNGSYYYQIPLNLSGNFKIKISSINLSTITDESNSDFTIAAGSINVLSPNGGEVFGLCMDQEVKWSNSIPNDPVKIELFKNGSIYSTLTANAGTYGVCKWTVPVNTPVSSDYKLKISSIALNSVYGSSSSDFTVNGTVINGGNVSGIWQPAGSPYVVTTQATVAIGGNLEIKPGTDAVLLDTLKVNGNLVASGSQNNIEIVNHAPLIAVNGSIKLQNCQFDNKNTAWTKIFNGTANYNDGVTSIVQTSDGGYALAGWTYGNYNDIWVIKLDAFGYQTWVKSFNGIGNYYDGASSIVQTTDGGYAVAGYTTYSSGYTDVWVLKLDANGNQSWTQSFDGTAHRWDGAHSIVQTADGGYVVAGYTTNNTNSRYVWVLKLSVYGNQVWAKTFAYGEANSIVQTMDGGYAVAAGNQVLKLDADGNQIWFSSVGAKSIVQTMDGSYTVAGGTVLSKLDALGNPVWTKTFAYNVANSIVQTADGGYAVAGDQVLKLDADGNQIWAKTFAYGETKSIVQSTDGGYVVTGNTTNSNSYTDVWVLKLNDNGNGNLSGNKIIMQNANPNSYLKNCLFSNSNKSAISLQNSSPAITNCTFSKNNADQGGAIYATGTSSPKITNSIFWGNTATTGKQIYLDGTTAKPEFKYNLIEGGYSAIGLGNGAALGEIWENNIATNPLFTDTISFQLTTNSPAINAGTPDIAGLNLPAYDLWGNARVADGRIDIGAYEYSTSGINNNLINDWNLSQNYPNPFNPQTMINYTIKDGFSGLVKLKIYNAKGEVVQTITNNVAKAGHYSQVFNGSRLSSGIYYYGIEAGDFKQMKKMVMVK